jgi:hypothetical protein
MASNKVIINNENNTVVVTEPIEGARIVKVIAAGPQGARGEGFNTVSSSLNDRIDVLEYFSGSYTGSFSGSFVGDASGLINIPSDNVVGLQLDKISKGYVTASVDTNTNAFKVFSNINGELLNLSNSGKLWVTGSISSSLIFGEIVSGSFIGNGNNLFFTTLNTSQSANSELVIGNIYGNYTNRQTTIFKNGDVIISGSLTLQPLTNTPGVVSGGIFYSSSGEFFVGIG